MEYWKQSGFVIGVVIVNVKLVVLARDVINGGVLAVVLHVTPSNVPTVVSAICVKRIVELLSITCEVVTRQFPDPATAHEKTPAAAPEHVATDGFAAVPCE
jgi:hypothetical protein